ncbi:MAG TPA: ABATE domain-containing protein [Natronosporangium sp.]
MAIELVGNALCLDFTNTVNARPVPTRDYLAAVEPTRRWADAVGLPITEPAEQLAAGLPEAREVRETIYRSVQPLADGGEPPRPDLDQLARWYTEAIGSARLLRTGAGFGFDWPGVRTLRGLLWRVVASAVALLTTGPLDRLGQCPSCGWLFLDTSRNRQRRWCSMATCGSREKARRYYHAGRSSAAGAPPDGGVRRQDPGLGDRTAGEHRLAVPPR